MYNIVRFEKVKLSDVKRVRNHNFRLSSNIENVDYTKTSENLFLVGNDNSQLDVEFLFLKNKFNFKFDEKRQNALTECLITASSEFFENKNKQEIIKYFKDNLKIFKKNFPDCPVINAIIHFDESTPHLHFVFANLVKTDEKKYKCSYEHYFGGRKKLSQIQTLWNKSLIELGYKLNRGIKGSKKKHKKPKEKILELEKNHKKLVNEYLNIYEKNIELKRENKNLREKITQYNLENEIDEKIKYNSQHNKKRGF